VHGIVPRDQLESAVEAMAHRLLAQPQEALKLAKRLLVDGTDLSLAEALDLERRLAARLVNT
jgi:enoyl-CoA hydratase/carnithine racemase